jgi:photosystem II stability/assembly factor-like uncharacterized protein
MGAKTMVKAILFCGFQMATSLLYAQWQQLQNVPTSENYHFIECVNDSTCCLASPQVALITRDRGDTWDTLSYSVDELISDLQIVNDSTIYLVVFNTLSSTRGLKKSYDLGQTWASINCPVGYKIHFTSLDTGHNYQATFIQRTIDGGTTWQITETSACPDVGNIYFLDPSTGYFAGNYPGTIYKTTDHGQSWTNQQVAGEFFDIHFATDQVGYAAGYYGEIFKTSDSGISWSFLTTGLLNTQTLRAVHALSDSVCYAAGDNGLLVKTADGGLVWEQDTLTTTQDLRALYCTRLYCYAVGDSGTVLRHQNINSNLSLLNHSVEDGILVFPNPTAQTITVSLPADERFKSLAIHGLNGQIYLSGENSTVDISNLAPGNYIVIVEGDRLYYRQLILKIGQ